MTEEIRRLYRSSQEKVIAGVCGGIAEYFNIDPVWPRLIAILLIFFNGVGIIGYIVLWILMPLNPKQDSTKKTPIEERVESFSKTIKKEFKEEVKKKAEKHNISEEEVVDRYIFKNYKNEDNEHNSNSNVIIGAILILIGGLFLAKEFFWTFASKIFWPAIIIGIGIILLFRRH